MPDLKPVSVPMDGVLAISRERGHQVLKGYTRAHDEQHGPGDLINAALAYASQAQDRISEAAGEDLGDREGPEVYWPWDSSTFSSTDDVIESLAKAGALIAAAIDVALTRQGGQVAS